MIFLDQILNNDIEFFMEMLLVVEILDLDVIDIVYSNLVLNLRWLWVVYVM